MKSKILAVLSIIYIYIYTIAAPNAWALNDATSFSPEQVQVQAANIGVPIGTVLVWTKEQIPDGWLECDGQKVNEVLYPELAALMPTTPDYKGRFLQGTDTNTKVGDRLEAGLPNISGWINNLIGNRGSADRDPVRSAGAFHHPTKVRHDAKGGDDDFGVYTVYFDAAYSNSIYGKSNTVQPPTVVVKYIIKAE